MDILNEYRDVPLLLQAENKIDHSQFQVLIAGIAAIVAKSEIVQPMHKLHICRDSEDDMLLECCVEADADFLITGDNDLLALDFPLSSLKIVTSYEYIRY